MTRMALIMSVIAHLMIYCDPDKSASDSNNTNVNSDDFNGDSTYSNSDSYDNNGHSSNSTSDYDDSTSIE